MDKVWGVVRHAIGLGGGVLIGLGLATSEDVAALMTNAEAVIGGIMAIVAFALSIAAKAKDLWGNIGKMLG